MKLIEGGIDLAQAFYGLGVIALKQQNLELAAQQFNNCLKQDPVHSNAMFQLGFIEKRKGNMMMAVRYWQQCLQANPQHGAAKNELASAGHLTASPPPPPPDHQHISVDPGGSHAPEPYFNQSVFPGPGPVVTGFDLYGLLQRSESGVEREITRLLDEIAVLVKSKRQRVRAFLGHFLFLWVLAIIGMVVGANVGRNEGFLISVCSFFGAMFFTVVLVLQIKCTKLTCDRYVLTQKTGVLSTHMRNDNLWLMSRGPASVSRTLLNRIMNEGTLQLSLIDSAGNVRPRGRSYRGFFTGKELELIQKNIAQLSLLTPTSREVLAAIGAITNMRTGTN